MIHLLITMLNVKPVTPFTTHETWYIHCSPLYRLSNLDMEDWSAIGVFAVAVPDTLDSSIAASTVLSAFHLTVPIKNVSAFDYTVYDPTGCEAPINYDLDISELAEDIDIFLVEDWWRQD